MPECFPSLTSSIYFSVYFSYSWFTYAYNPKLAAYAINTRIQPVKNLEYITESTPTSIVSGSASASPRPTGIKSHAPWQLIAKSAGSAS